MCYAPNFASSGEDKDSFYSSLQEALRSIPSQELSPAGGFDARVGSRMPGDEWWDERSLHGAGVFNNAGRELLSFLSVNGATVCNTWFQKQTI